MHSFASHLHCLAIVLALAHPALTQPKKEGNPKASDAKNAAYNQRILDTRVDLEFKEATIENVLTRLNQVHRTNFVVDLGRPDSSDHTRWNDLRSHVEGLVITTSLKNVKLG